MRTIKTGNERYKIEFSLELENERKAKRLFDFSEQPYIKDYLPKRRLTGVELGVLHLTDLCQRINQERSGKEIKPLITDTKYRLLKRRVNEVSTYTRDYEEYNKAAEILYIQEQWARSVYKNLILKICYLHETLQLVEVAETHEQKLKETKGKLTAYDKDLEYTNYTLKNIVADRPEAALLHRGYGSLRQIQKDMYFVCGFNDYLTKLSAKLKVSSLIGITLNTSKLSQYIAMYNRKRHYFEQYLIKNGRSIKDIQTLEEVFPELTRYLPQYEQNVKALITAETLITKHDIFKGGYVNTVFYLFTDDDAGRSL